MLESRNAEGLAEHGQHFVDGVHAKRGFVGFELDDESLADTGQFGQLLLAELVRFAPEANERSYGWIPIGNVNPIHWSSLACGSAPVNNKFPIGFIQATIVRFDMTM